MKFFLTVIILISTSSCKLLKQNSPQDDAGLIGKWELIDVDYPLKRNGDEIFFLEFKKNKMYYYFEASKLCEVYAVVSGPNDVSKYIYHRDINSDQLFKFDYFIIGDTLRIKNFIDLKDYPDDIKDTVFPFKNYVKC